MRIVVVSLVQLAAFLVFVVLCAAIPSARERTQRRRRIVALAAYLVVTNLAIGITQKDAWPLTNYRLMHGLVNPMSEEWRVGFFGVDRSGREWRIDPHTWRAISDWHLQFWVLKQFENSSPAEREEVLRHLLWLAEKDRAFVTARGRLPNHSLLGPLAAPQWWLWNREPRVPREPYAKIRLYKEIWTFEDKLATGRNRERKLLGEWTAR